LGEGSEDGEGKIDSEMEEFRRKKQSSEEGREPEKGLLHQRGGSAGEIHKERLPRKANRKLMRVGRDSKRRETLASAKPLWQGATAVTRLLLLMGDKREKKLKRWSENEQAKLSGRNIKPREWHQNKREKWNAKQHRKISKKWKQVKLS